MEEQEDDYVGKQALEHIRLTGVKRKLVGIEFDGEPIAGHTERWPVLVDGREVGKVTSAAYSPRLDRNIGFGWVPIQCEGVGSPIDIEVQTTAIHARVAAIPFH